MKKQIERTETDLLIQQANAGDAKALESLLLCVQDTIFNLSLRMLGTVPDAEDATQDILVRVMTSLSSFRRESSFETWVYRIAVNHLLNYKKSMFARCPLDFEFYGNDIRFAKLDETDNLIDDLCRETLAEELKMSCTNVMLQCLDAQSRCIFILGTMFKLDSHTAAELFDITPENYRQKLSRIRKKVGDFLTEHCGLAGSSLCSCYNRVSYAISQGRLHPDRMEYSQLEPVEKDRMFEFKEEMEHLDALACSFEQFPCYRSTVTAQTLIQTLLNSEHWLNIQNI